MRSAGRERAGTSVEAALFATTHDTVDELANQAPLDLATGAAAWLLVEVPVRLRMDPTPRADGATNWRSVALHVVAARRFRDGRLAAALDLYRQACEADGDNLAAQHGLLSSELRSRPATETAEARAARWARCRDDLALVEAAARANEADALAVRALYGSLAAGTHVLLERLASSGRLSATDVADRDALACRARVGVATIEATVRDGRLDQAGKAFYGVLRDMVASIDGMMVRLGSKPGTAPGVHLGLLAPRARYNRACELATPRWDGTRLVLAAADAEAARVELGLAVGQGPIGDWAALDPSFTWLTRIAPLAPSGATDGVPVRYPLADVPAVGQVARRLAKLDDPIWDARGLAGALATPVGRTTVATALGLTSADLEDWRRQLDLLAHVGGRAGLLRLLLAAGVGSVAELATRDASALRSRLATCAGAAGHPVVVPDVTALEAYISSAAA